MVTGKSRVGNKRKREREIGRTDYRSEVRSIGGDRKIAWVENDPWKSHLRIWGLTEQTNVNQIGYKYILGGFLNGTVHLKKLFAY
jgi:hypothetical protein